MQDLGTLGGGTSHGNDINELGHVVGYSLLSSDRTRAFLYNGSTMLNLGVLAGGDESLAFGMNNSGQVVGRSDAGSAPYKRAFVYDSLNGMVDLNTLIPQDSGWALTAAYSINDLGQIVGQGEIDGTIHGFVLTPVPEPGTILLSVTISARLLFVTRKKLVPASA